MAKEEENKQQQNPYDIFEDSRVEEYMNNSEERYIHADYVEMMLDLNSEKKGE